MNSIRNAFFFCRIWIQVIWLTSNMNMENIEIHTYLKIFCTKLVAHLCIARVPPWVKGLVPVSIFSRFYLPFWRESCRRALGCRAGFVWESRRSSVICPRLLQSRDQSQIFALRLTIVSTIRGKEKIPLAFIF